MGTQLCKAAKEKGMCILAMKEMIERRWINLDERINSQYPFFSMDGLGLDV